MIRLELRSESFRILAFGLTLVKIRDSDGRIKISRVLLDSGDDFRLGVEIVSCDFHKFRIKETSDSCFDCSIRSRTSSIIDFHM
ncbi:hypothetical protein H5410_042528 [Solanum commersonii]|uniref:Uncharacterized protein n=1 Tax=Solanum commersonii TaxID=4109 RepID=A0A9J5XYU4_SOLCO|nr:hypothetical protein H5410_042528 [Solanum commersonii]